jgi:predicted nucleic acid-binding protein
MPAYFVDSSALVKRYRYEAGTERVAELLDLAEALIVARLTQVEVSSAIVRRGRATSRSTQEITQIPATFDRNLQESFDVVELDALVFDRAIEVTRKHGLRAADAIQLACAIVARGDAPGRELTVLASDQELLAAAEAEGLSILDPTRR